MVSVLSAVRDLARLREISSVLVRHGFGEVVARGPNVMIGYTDEDATRRTIDAEKCIAAAARLR